MKNIIKIMVILILLIKPIMAFTEQELNFNQSQKQVLYNSYEIGNELTLEYYGSEDLGYLMAAIAWQETKAGVRVQNSNPSHHAYGVFQNYLPTIRTRANRLNLGLSDTELKNLVMDDMYASASFAIMELRDWDKYHKGKLDRILSSYFAGFKWKSSKWYYNAVMKKLNWLKSNDYFNTAYDEKGFILQ